MHHRNRLALASALPFFALTLLAPTPAAAQGTATPGPACQVSRFRLEILTGGDDLRGGQNNLNIEIHLVNGRVQTFADVNHNANWGNNSRHVVDLDLHPPTAANEISYLRLIHLAQSELVISPETVASPVGVASGVKTQDNWDMTRVTVSAPGMGSNVGEAGPFRFTGDNTQLSVHLRFPPNVCSPGGASSTGRALPATAMTNQDVVRMASAGVPESAIVAAIKRSRPNFDFSPAAQQELNHAGVSPALLRAMHEQGAPAADDLNPQPYPPKAAAGRTFSPAKGNFTLPPNVRVLAGPVVRNSVGASEIMAARAGSPLPRPRLRSTPTNPYALAPAARVCMGPAAIASVEANPSPIPSAALQFTPDGSTEYIITGCGFGKTPGRVALTGNFTAHGGQVALLPYHPFGTPTTSGWGSHWSDTRIEAMVDPSVSGEMDMASVALAVTPASGAPVNRSNLAFRARRGSPILLGQLPASAFCAGGISAGKPCEVPGYVTLGGAIVSPCGAWVLHDCTAEVLRSGFHLPADYKMPEDFYTLNLKPGFSLYSAAVQVVGLDDKLAHVIPVPIIRGNVIAVQPPIYGDPTNLNSYTLSLYGLRIMVVGPDGVANPWVGQ